MLKAIQCKPIKNAKLFIFCFCRAVFLLKKVKTQILTCLKKLKI